MRTDLRAPTKSRYRSCRPRRRWSASTSPSFADERDVPSDRFQLAVDRRDAHSEQGRRFGAGEIASGEQQGDELRGTLDGTEASEVRARHDPWRIVRSAEDLNCRNGPRS